MITGHIYRIHTTLANPPKTKIVLCVGDLFLWFNSEAQRRPAQMQVRKAEAPGITKDCYLDCGRVTVFRPSELAAAKDQGACTGNFLLRVVDEIENRARSLTNLQRRKVAQALRDLVRSMDKKPY